jgi:hypothetical protein
MSEIPTSFTCGELLGMDYLFFLSLYLSPFLFTLSPAVCGRESGERAQGRGLR